MTKRKKAHSLRLTEYWPVQKEISWGICLLSDILSHPHLCKLSGVNSRLAKTFLSDFHSLGHLQYCKSKLENM